MTIISVRDNKNNRSKRNAEKPPPKKRQKRTRGPKAIVKG